MRRSDYSDEDLESTSLTYAGACSKGGVHGSTGGLSGVAGASCSKNEEDRHRRTIIIERKQNSYGFTLQSYGIHYKKEQEVEMLTYVDSVEYDGPAYKAGMREGDVILSINGVDMEKADHNALVAFIKDCDTRMRMVVLFEDCVRKVGLHMRYIHLQNVLQNKMTELEALLQREREILEGKWKTHSLPARKKTAGVATLDGHAADETGTVNNGDGSFDYDEENLAKKSQTASNIKTNTLPLMNRSAISSENVTKSGMKHAPLIEHFTPNAQVLLQYQYINPTSRTNLMKSSHSSGIDSSGEGGLKSSAISSSREDNLNDYYGLATSNNNIYRHNRQHQPQSSHHHRHHHDSSNCSTLSNRHTRNGQENHESNADGDQHQSRHSQYYSSHLNEDASGGRGTDAVVVVAKKGSSGTKSCRQSYYCNPCMGHSKKSDADKNGGDNVSLDAYDLASSCCDPHQCVPIRRRSRHNHCQDQLVQQQQTQNHHHHHHHHRQGQSQQQHHQHQQSHQKHHKHKHDAKGPRPKSQSNLPTSTANVLVQATQSMQKSHAHYYNGITCSSRCSLHSTGSEAVAPSTSYCSTSLSADTLNDWGVDDCGGGANSGRENTPNHTRTVVKCCAPGPMHATTMPHQMVTRFYQHTVQIQPADYHQQNFMQKPKSWDNLATTKAIGGYGFGYGFVDAAAVNRANHAPPVKLHHHGGGNYGHIQATQSNVVRKNVYHHYSSAAAGNPGAGGGTEGPDVASTMTTILTTTTTTSSGGIDGATACGPPPLTFADPAACNPAAGVSTSTKTANKAK